jgi:hypothetical protein
MMDSLEAFAIQIPDLPSRTPAELIDYFAYFLTVVQQENVATPIGVARCFELLKIPAYSNISAYLSRHAKRGKSQKFLKMKGGYTLSRGSQLQVQKNLHTGPAKLETSLLLRGLLPKVADTAERAFLQEAVDCYEIGARRASIVMTWQLAIHHLCTHVLAIELIAFNDVLSKNTDKRVKATSVSKIDDFSDIPEGKLIEFLRSARIISNDVRKILEAKLDIRNSCAHPSAITVSEVKATEFVIDLIDNVVAKF